MSTSLVTHSGRKCRKKQIRVPLFVVAFFSFFFINVSATSSTVAGNASDRLMQSLISERCVECHHGEDAEAGLDLEAILRSTEKTQPHDSIPQDLLDSWVRIEKAITQRLMPPADEASLSDDEVNSFTAWVRERLVLKNGQPHIGPTPLRRLTQEEFLNSLEDLLGISVRNQYNHLHSVHVEKGLVDRVLPVGVPGNSGFNNDAHALAAQPVPLLAFLKCIDFALSKMAGSAAARKKLFGTDALPDTLSDQQIASIAGPFLSRALRGRNTTDHLNQAIASYRQAKPEKSTLVALKAMLRTILLLPEFHYRLETAMGQSVPYPVTDIEFATRLSYFLTSSTPDDELLDIAATGKIRESATLEKQIRRLLNTPRRLSLSESFAAQWIGFDELLDETDVDERGVPTTRRAKYDELLYFFDELFKSDLSVLNIIESDWVYVSNYTINAYGKDQFQNPPPLKSVHADVLGDRRLTGKARRGIERIYDPPVLRGLKGERYGGIITSAAVMSLTSAPQRTSPVRRGVWMLDRMLGQPLEAPANVPPIENAIQSLPAKKPSKLEIIRAHTALPACMLCHQDIDPIGFGLENFDPEGRWRNTYRDKRAIESEGTLPSGKTFANPKELKQQLLTDYRESVVRNFIRRLMAYALGRALQPYDRITEDMIYQRVLKSSYRSNAVIHAIIDSQQFNCRQDEGS